VRYGTLSLLAAIGLLTGEAIPYISPAHNLAILIDKYQNTYGFLM